MDSNDPPEHTAICCLKREAQVKAWDEIKHRKWENTDW